MSRKHDMSHNVCYDYNALRWNVQPSDFVAFDDLEGSYYIGEILSLARDLMYVQRVKDGRIFVLSLYELRYRRVKPVDYVRRLPSGVFSVGESVRLSCNLNFEGVEYVISSFDDNLVKVRLFENGCFLGFYFVSGYDVLKKEYKKNEK